MEHDECLEFLTAWPSRLVSLSVARRDGTTMTLPLWYRLDNEALLIWTTRERGWVKNLLRTGHASFSVAEETHPYRAVTGRGKAALLTDGEIDVDQEVAQIVARYIHPDLAATYIAKWAHLRDLARIEIDHLHGWSLGY